MSNVGFSSKEELFPGLWLYRDVVKPEINAVERIEKTIKDSQGLYNWKEATVGYREKVPEYRDCYDFKLNKMDYPGKDQYMLEFDDIWQDLYDAQKVALDDYCRYYNIEMKYWEAMNFIKYGPGQHFAEHSDHGWSYIATVSMVGYFNDDYEGGGLSFGKLGIEVQPKAGDLFIFPSTFLFSHRALPVLSGEKYSLVTMTDWNDSAHSPEFYRKHASPISMKDDEH
jgi:hypothetical protein